MWTYVFSSLLLYVASASGQNIQPEDIMLLVPTLTKRLTNDSLLYSGVAEAAILITNLVKNMTNVKLPEEKKLICAEFIKIYAETSKINKMTNKCSSVIDQVEKSKIRTEFIFIAIRNSTLLGRKTRAQIKKAFRLADKVDYHRLSKSLDFWFGIVDEFGFVPSHKMEDLKSIVNDAIDLFKRTLPQMAKELYSYKLQHDESHFVDPVQLDVLSNLVESHVRFMLKPNFMPVPFIEIPLK